MSRVAWIPALLVAAHAWAPASGHGAGAEAGWKIAGRIEVGEVPSAFPVGFSLLTHGGRQYAAYYDTGHRMTVAVRDLGSADWHKRMLDSKVGWDSHNGITMAVDAGGDLHLAGNMHCVPLIYFRTGKPGDIDTFKRLPMTGQNEDRCTYPNFLRDADGRLLFLYRDGGSGNGNHFINAYDDASKRWSRLLGEPLFNGQGRCNAYPRGPQPGPDGLFHVLWVWRDTPDCATNHSLSYARSRNMIRWETAAGQPVELPLTPATAEVVVDPSPAGGGMINGGQRLAFDAAHRPLIVYHKNDRSGHMQLFAARFEGGRWLRRVLTGWDKPVVFSGRGSMPFIGIAITSLQRTGDGVWTVGYRHRDYGAGAISFSEETLRPLDDAPQRPPPKLPAELSRPEISFENLGVRHAEDLGDSGNPGVRFVMTWETLPANHDRKRSGPLPPPSMLRVFKLVRDEGRDQAPGGPRE